MFDFYISYGTFNTYQNKKYHNWDKEQQSKAQNLDSKYRQMALVGFDT